MVYEGDMRVHGLHQHEEHLQQLPCPFHTVQTDLKERVYGSTNTTVLSSDSVISPTNMCVGGLLGSFTMGCGHACT